MKKFQQKTMNSLAVILMAVIFYSCSSDPEPIVGTWQEYDESTDSYVIMTFEKNNYVYIKTIDEEIGGKNFSIIEDGVEIISSLTYETDYSKDPHWIDILMHFHDAKPINRTDKLSNEQKRMLEEFMEPMKGGLRAVGIFEFTEEGHLKMQLNMDAWEYSDNRYARRPEYFTPELVSTMERTKD